MNIRPFKLQPALSRIFFRAVREIASHHYSPAQIDAWAPSVPSADRFIDRANDGRLLLVATDDSDEPLAYGDLEKDGHIDHLFRSPAANRTDIASTLYDAIEAAAVYRGMKRVYVEASEPARRFFLRKNFTVVERRDFLLAGVPIHNFAMEKLLD